MVATRPTHRESHEFSKQWQVQLRVSEKGGCVLYTLRLGATRIR